MGAAFDPYRPIWDTWLAARHLGAKPSDVKRWVLGYTRGGQHRPPLIKRKDPTCQHVNFMDFVELLYLKAMREAGITLPKIKQVYETIEAHFGHDIYPLARHQDFFKVGKRLLVACEFGKLDASSQFHLEQIVIDLGEQIRVEDGTPVEWWPLKKHRLVVMKPGYNGSNPSADRVPTQALHGLYVAENRDIEAVADWFNVSEQAVIDAVEYEEKLLAA